MDALVVITLVPADDDAAFAELCLQEQRSAWRSIAVLSEVGEMNESRNGLTLRAEAGAIHQTDLQFVVSLAEKVIPTLGTALIAWLGGRFGRKTRVKIGDTEIEANTAEEVSLLLTKLNSFDHHKP